jgi:hypothetical protein
MVEPSESRGAIELQLVAGGIADRAVLDAFRAVRRERFVPQQLLEFAAENAPLPIGEGQTISQPYIVALTVEALRLRGGERVLEVGTGSGYAAAILGAIAGEVYTIERTATSWNLRDTHMFETLQSLLAFYGPGSKGIVWAHNSHVGDASATEMRSRGELNIGQLCRASFARDAYIVGFGTDHGTVAAASGWDEPMQRMQMRPAHAESYEHLFHACGVPALMLHLREPARRALREELEQLRLERAIGVIYRPETEMASHYFAANLPSQFDEYVWFDETRAVRPLGEIGADARRPPEVPDTYPFGL